MKGDPAALWHALWESLAASVDDRHGAFRTMVLATVRDGAPEARALVLRAALEALRELWFHTDLRSPKVEDLRHEPRVTVTQYAVAAKRQVRIRGTAVVETAGPRVEGQWAKAGSSAGRTYCTRFAPSTPIAEAHAYWDGHLDGRAPNGEELAAARANFGVLVVRATSVEILDLRATGHERLEWRADRHWHPHWLTP